MNYLLIGSGQVGSRHLQALATMPESFTVYVIEQTLASQELAQIRWEQVESHRNKRLIFIAPTDMKQHAQSIKAAIIATPAIGRIKVLDFVLSLGIKNILCEKILFQSIAEYQQALRLTREYGARVYVNHLTRYVPLYMNMKNALKRSPAPLSVTMKAGNIGMACNLIHYLDLLEFITGHFIDKIDFKLDMPLLPCKRGPDLIEFTGSAIASTPEGDVLDITCVGHDLILPAFEFRYADKYITASEHTQSFVGEDGVEQPLNAPLVSQNTARMMREIELGTTALPTIEDNFTTNKHMLNAFNNALHTSYDDHTICPIT